MLDRLRENGFEPGRNVIYERFNAENDMATANSIAKEMTSGKCGFAFTVSSMRRPTNISRKARYTVLGAVKTISRGVVGCVIG